MNVNVAALAPVMPARARRTMVNHRHQACHNWDTACQSRASGCQGDSRTARHRCIHHHGAAGAAAWKWLRFAVQGRGGNTLGQVLSSDWIDGGRVNEQ